MGANASPTSIPTSVDGFLSLQTEAEENCISIAVIAPHLVELMSSIVSRRDFIEPLMGDVWQLIVDMREAGQGFDTNKFQTECTKRGYTQRFGGLAGIARIINRAPNYAHAEYYARELARMAEIRRVESALLSAIKDLESLDADPTKVVQSLMSRVEGIGNSKDAGFKTLGSVIKSILDRDKVHDEAAQAKTVFKTGFAGLDRMVRGFSPGKLILIGGRSGIGKSAFASNIAVNIASEGRAVWYASLEMEAAELGERILSDKANIDMDSWRGKLGIDQRYEAEEWARTEAPRIPLFITDKGHESFSTIKAKARLRKSLSGLDVIVIDNLQLIKSLDYKAPKHERLKSMTEALKVMAKDLNVAIVLLCQLSIPEDAKELPNNFSWADSKRIVDDADLAMILHRTNEASAEGQVIITKGRGNRLGVVNVAWEGKFQRFK